MFWRKKSMLKQEGTVQRNDSIEDIYLIDKISSVAILME